MIQQMMNLAVFDRYVLSKDADAVARGVANFAVAERDVVSRDLDAVAASPLAVDQIVFVNAGFGDL